ncbi:MAG: hypothetical protein EOR85_12825 [Mesorhizobium sp.]|uniref:hypothetical protein n=1 Tax=Mesorhizobium sp. TaxID=1871066 RepID=UPI000FE80178|nr:hypothetical protein [Mesorhizobium sp.]RWK61828.1 MAG: hypothetical protein EOR49_16210 [Mesorhizobium sp.]RWM47653.1 MAG: hypothetical protein EOR76_14150 [Mesorhizobium sp.]RWN02385.1 MAG: hypothetical protein EOR85_12825 [Mesorhizobium sp.]TJV33910.1 MAG: hypothetical protein E5X87_11415 [Mesorhizobium sp.]
MKVCTVQLKSATAYSQSKKVDDDIFPRLEKESVGDYDLRLWREKATVNGDGIVCLPAMGLKMAVDEAVKRLNIKVAERGKSTYTKYFVAGQICDGDVPIGIAKDDLDYIDIWANADGVRGSGKRVKRRFPYIKAWQGIATFHILDDMIPRAVFEKALTEAGRLVGIGRFRPEKGGLLGRFVATSFDWQEI